FGGGQVFAKAGEVYAIYLPDASSSGTLDLSGASSSLEQYWYNPRTGSFVGSPININGGGNVTLGAPPADADEDWVILITNGDPIETPTPGPTPTVGPTATPITPLPLQVSSFTLINADTDEEIQPLNNGDTINYATLSTMNLNVRANVAGEDESVVFELDTDSIVRTENTAPYALAGDSAGDYAAWTPTLGTHQLVATPYGGENASGEVGIPLSITFFVIDDATAPTATPIPVNENVLYLPLIEK
ncbi:MAG: putative collagen-binding domain-containing protein, partial [Chloroflexota bacterium]